MSVALGNAPLILRPEGLRECGTGSWADSWQARSFAVDEGNAENFHAMFDYTKEYGVY